MYPHNLLISLIKYINLGKSYSEKRLVHVNIPSIVQYPHHNIATVSLRSATIVIISHQPSSYHPSPFRQDICLLSTPVVVINDYGHFFRPANGQFFISTPTKEAYRGVAPAAFDRARQCASNGHIIMVEFGY